MYDEYDKNIINYSEEPPKKPSAFKRFSLFILDMPGALLHWSIEGIASAFTSLKEFCEKYKRAISIAFWAAIIIAAIAAIAATVMAFAFPGTWGIVAGFSVFGLSIAGITGTNLALQVTLFAALAFAAADIIFTPLCVIGASIYNYCFPDKKGPILHKPSVEELYGYSRKVEDNLKSSNYSYVNPEVHYDSPISSKTTISSTNPFNADENALSVNSPK